MKELCIVFVFLNYKLEWQRFFNLSFLVSTPFFITWFFIFYYRTAFHAKLNGEKVSLFLQGKYTAGSLKISQCTLGHRLTRKAPKMYLRSVQRLSFIHPVWNKPFSQRMFEWGSRKQGVRKSSGYFAALLATRHKNFEITYVRIDPYGQLISWFLRSLWRPELVKYLLFAEASMILPEICSVIFWTDGVMKSDNYQPVSKCYVKAFLIVSYGQCIQCCFLWQQLHCFPSGKWENY